MRIGLVGVGRIGAFHAQTLRDIAEVDSVVVADADAARARDVGARLAVETVDTVAQLLSSGIDGLVVAAATDAHAELVVAAVEANLPVFCEKPVAPDVEGTLDVIKRVSDSDVPVQIGFQRRFDAGYAAARAAVGSGSLGWVHTMRATTLDAAPPPAAYIATSGGLFRDCSVHDFDVIRWVSGREVAEVYAVGSNRGATFFAESGDVATAAAVLTLDDATLGLVSAARYNAAGYDVRLEVLGSKDSISVGMEDRMPLRSVEPGTRFPAGPAHPTFMQRFRSAYIGELASFVDVVAGRRAPACDVHDALEAFYIAEACELSRRDHRPVTLAEVRR